MYSELLGYNVSGADLIQTPFRVVGAAGAGGLFFCTVLEKDEAVDTSERIQFTLGRGVLTWGVVLGAG